MLEVRPVFNVSVRAAPSHWDWTLSLVINVYNGYGGSSLVTLARGTLPVTDTETANAMAMKAAQKWLRSQLNNIDTD